MLAAAYLPAPALPDRREGDPMIQIYGVPLSRAFRPLWMLEELGVPYENVPTNFATGETRRPEFLKLNPNGHVPVLVDGDVTLFESMAINLYLARKYDGDKGLWPRGTADEGRAYQWSFWVMTEVEEPLLTYLFNVALLPPDKRDAEKAADAASRLAKPLAVLNDALAGRDWLVGSGFGVADLNVAAVLAWARMSRLDLLSWPNVAAWLGRCLDRPAARKASGRG
jgi:glutathione S-transferase